MRRESLGCKRAGGTILRRENRRVRRANARTLRRGADDRTLSGLGGLVRFNAFVQEQGLPARFRSTFGRLKTSARVVYPIHCQMQLLLDAAVAGARRVFDVEHMAPDPVFTHLAGGSVPSIDTLYDDLRRFDAQALDDLEDLVMDQGLLPLRDVRHAELTVDIDTTVTPLFGRQQGALPGPNPRYRGRPSYHPLLIRLAETDTIIAARLRPGDRGFGEADVEDVVCCLEKLHRAAPESIVTVRIDAAGDCASVLNAIDKSGGYFVVKARQTANLLSAVARTKKWTTVDHDASGRAERQVAWVEFQREDWAKDKFRVLAVRTTEREIGKQVYLWDDLDYSVQLYITNDRDRDADTLARLYDKRAGIEPRIGELKNDFGIGKVSSEAFDANEAAFLLKVLAYNLVRRWVASMRIPIESWRACWVRHACICIPARLVRTGGRAVLRLAPRPMMN